MARRDESLCALLLLWWLLRARGAPATPGAPAPYLLAPGWWWGWLTNDEAPAYQSWWTRNRANVVVRKTYGGPAYGIAIVLIEVLAPVAWTLERRPQPAPRGAETDLTDIAAALPEPPSALRKMVEAVAKQTWDYLRQLATGQRPPPEPFPGAP